MTLTQSWVGYLDRSYEQIKKSCLKRLSVLAPEISDHSESNPLVIILSMFAGIGEMLNLYVDSAAREVYLGTCRRYSSAVKLVKLIDYNIRARNPSSVNIQFLLVDVNGDPITLLPGQSVLIPLGTVITSNPGNIPFVLQNDLLMQQGSQNIFGPASQFTKVIAAIIGTTNGAALQKLSISPLYVDGSMEIIINAETWTLYKSFGLMGPLTKGFIISVDEDSNAFIQFGDGTNGKIPTASFTIFGDYKESYGATGNLPPDQITQITGSTITTPAGVSIIANNPDYSSGGTNFETLDDIKNRAPRSIRTLDRAVTYQDYKDLCYMVLGVGAAEIKYCCGKFIEVYIAPNSAGNATLALLQAVFDYLECRKMITTQILVRPAGIAKIWIKAKVYGKPLKLATDIYDEVVDELDNLYGYGNLQINPKVSIPNIIAKVKELSTVDNIEIEQVRILPYARPYTNNGGILGIAFITLPITTIRVNYAVIWRTSIFKFEVYRNNSFQGNYAIDQVYTDSVVSFKMLTGSYNNNDRWDFVAYPSYPEIFPTSVVEIKDYSAAVIEVGPQTNTGPRTIYSNITIITQGSTGNCKPPCE